MTTQVLKTLKENLWAATFKQCVDSDFKTNEFYELVPGLIFLKFVDNKFRQVEEEIKEEFTIQ